MLTFLKSLAVGMCILVPAFLLLLALAIELGPLGVLICLCWAVLIFVCWIVGDIIRSYW